ncbi:MCE family protein [Nonomuraea sp. NPDC050536]|uniref:MCE family protein n=1 Tax=Nonomuraea sp. NPDC050536 TaxID=3364366 RepID=UPI0037C939E7
MRYGVALVLIMAAFVAVTVGAYQGVFSDATSVTLAVPRAGLQLGPRADVKVHGVVVGEVSALRATATGAEITLALDQPVDHASTARLVPKTLFGEKYVDLIPPAHPTTPLRDGDTITASARTVETTQVLDRLLPELRSLHPERINSTLNALATALDGRGARLGDTLERADGYLARLQPYLPTIKRDLAKLADVTALYGEAAPDLLRTLDNTAALSRVITGRRARIDRAVAGVTATADRTGTLLADNELGLIGLQHVARPALTVTARYSPSIACVFQGLERLHPMLDSAFGGGRLKTVLEIVKPVPPYHPGQDDPRYADTRGPRCYGLPDHPPIPFPQIHFDDGTQELAGLMLR